MSYVKSSYMDGFVEVVPNVLVNPITHELVVIGTPEHSDDDDNPKHNCDVMGCGWNHVLYRTTLRETAP